MANTAEFEPAPCAGTEDRTGDTQASGVALRRVVSVDDQQIHLLLDDFVSAVEDSWRRHASGEAHAFESHMLCVAYRAACAVLDRDVDGELMRRMSSAATTRFASGRAVRGSRAS